MALLLQTILKNALYMRHLLEFYEKSQWLYSDLECQCQYKQRWKMENVLVRVASTEIENHLLIFEYPREWKYV